MTASSQTSKSLPYHLFALVGAAAAFTGLIISAVLVGKHEGVLEISAGCVINGTDGCANLGKLPASRFLGFGPHIAWLGFFYYVTLSVLFLVIAFVERVRRASLIGFVFGLVVFGVFYDLFLAYTNLFVLETPCVLCIYTYAAQLGALIAAAVLYWGVRTDAEAFTLKAFVDAALGVWYAPVIALAAVLLLWSVYFVGMRRAASGAGGGGQGAVQAVLPLESVGATLAELRALKQVPVSTQGLTQFEGPDDAYIIIHKWADFRCPHCLHASEYLQLLMRRWPGRIRVYYRHFPLDGVCNPHVQGQRGGYSCNGAQASLCAAEQNLFAPYYHGLFNFQNTGEELGLRELERLTQSLNGDWSRMVRCMGSAATNQKLQRDINDGQAIGLEATPTLVVQGAYLRGAPPLDWFIRVVDAMVLEKEGAAAIEDFNRRQPR